MNDEPLGMMAAGPNLETDALWERSVGVCVWAGCGRAFISRARFDDVIVPAFDALAARVQAVEREHAQLKMDRPDGHWSNELTIRSLQVESLRQQLADRTRERDEAIARSGAAQVGIEHWKQQVARLREALQGLYDEQNDAPLETRRKQWQAAMNRASESLRETGA